MNAALEDWGSLDAGFLEIRYEIRDTHMVEESVLMTLKDKADFSNFKPRPFNMREFYDRTGHDLKDMLLSCYYRGVECSAEDFTVMRITVCIQTLTVAPVGGASSWFVESIMNASEEIRRARQGFPETGSVCGSRGLIVIALGEVTVRGMSCMIIRRRSGLLNLEEMFALH
ncbi:hypothetical protein DNTS_022045 [Danionella cerebrum]|uniref:Uncharacterized protein n=1 Tax=Danionella cerebrum TaxID=2873325 RepID=A0A553R0Y4_9TELE|nr:hypothetical protein DNTS_022045 [Danionella translucida]